MEIVHKNISENNFGELNPDQRKYADHPRILIGERFRVNTYDAEKPFNYKINNIQPIPKVEFYYEIDQIYGVIASIGSNSLDAKSSIRLSKSGYDILISERQEKELLKYFKKNKLFLTVKKKINAETDKVESAELLDFEGTKGNFVENAKKLVKKYPKRGLFSNIKDTSSEAVRKLRGYPNINIYTLRGLAWYR